MKSIEENRISEEQRSGSPTLLATAPVETRNWEKIRGWAVIGFFAGCLIFFVFHKPNTHIDMMDGYAMIALIFFGVIHAVIWSLIGAGLAFIRNDRIRRACVVFAAFGLLFVLYLTWRTPAAT